MSLLETYGKEIVALIVPFITLALNLIFKSKAKLFISSPHNFTFLVQQPLIGPDGNQISPTQTVQTSSIILRNAGKETATKVELVFNWKPLCINIWPTRHFTEHIEPDNRYVLIFDSLSPGEVLGCELFAINAQLPLLITARCDQCVAQNIEMYPQPVVKVWVQKLAALLMLCGLGLIVYLAILLLQFLILKTPLG